MIIGTTVTILYDKFIEDEEPAMELKNLSDDQAVLLLI